MSAIEIRPGRPEHSGVIVDFQLRLAKETEDLELDRPVVELGVRAIFEDPNKGQYFMAVEGDKLLGCLLTMPEWSEWRNGTVLWIHSVFIIPEARRRGIFRTFYRHLATMVESRDDLRGLRLYVDKRNQAACRTYESLGMTREHYHLYEWLP